MKFNQWTLGLALIGAMALTTFDATTTSAQTTSSNSVATTICTAPCTNCIYTPPTATSPGSVVVQTAGGANETLATVPATGTGVTTVTGTGVNTATAPTNGFWGDLGALAGDVGLSSNPTNYAFGLFGGIKTDGSQYSIGAYVVENVNNFVGVMVGVDQLFGGGKVGSENIVAGGLTLKAPTHPLRFLTSATNTFLYNVQATPYVAALASTPIGGTGNAGGGLGALVRGGLNVDIYNWSGWQLAAGVDYGNRTGSGAYNGNWIDGTINIRKGF